MKHICSIKKV